MKYPMVATVDRMVTDTISIGITADTHEEAIQIARIVLDGFPEEHNEEGCYFCFVENREYHRPELIDLEEAKIGSS